MEMNRKPLPAPLRSRVNQLAHRLGQQHAQQQRSAITAELERLAATGARYSDIAAALERIEASNGGR